MTASPSTPKRLPATPRPRSSYGDTATRVLLAAVFLVLASIGGLEVSRLQRSTANGEILQRVKDCTEPTGGCFMRGQSNTAAAVASINNTIQVAVYCANQGGDLAAIQACVRREISRLPVVVNAAKDKDHDGIEDADQ